MGKHFSPEEIKAIRIELGLSHREFAKLLGTDTARVIRWEAGDSNPIDRMQQKIAGLVEKAKAPVSVEQPVTKPVEEELAHALAVLRRYGIRSITLAPQPSA